MKPSISQSSCCGRQQRVGAKVRHPLQTVQLGGQRLSHAGRRRLARAHRAHIDVGAVLAKAQDVPAQVAPAGLVERRHEGGVAPGGRRVQIFFQRRQHRVRQQRPEHRQRFQPGGQLFQFLRFHHPFRIAP